MQPMVATANALCPLSGTVSHALGCSRAVGFAYMVLAKCVKLYVAACSCLGGSSRGLLADTRHLQQQPHRAWTLRFMVTVFVSKAGVSLC